MASQRWYDGTADAVYQNIDLIMERAPAYVLVRAEAGEDIGALAKRIETETGLRALTWRQFMWATINYYLERTGIPVNFGITVALGFIVSAAVLLGVGALRLEREAR